MALVVLFITYKEYVNFVSRVQSQLVAIVTNNYYYSLSNYQAKHYAVKLKFSITCSSFLITQGIIIINESSDKRQ